MKRKKIITIFLVLSSCIALAGSSFANSISFSGNVSFNHNQAISAYVYDCPTSLKYTFLSDKVSLPQFDPSSGILKSIELIVESDIDVETYYYYGWDTAHASQHWYSNVVGSIYGLQATFDQDHNYHVIGEGYHTHAFTIDGIASNSISSGLEGFIGTSQVDVAITGGDMLCAWWNPYIHVDTDTYGTVTATLIYNYVLSVMIDIKPGSDPNCFNLNDKGVIPVAILSSADFDATTVDPETVSLEGMAVKAVGKGNKLLAHIEDINADGLDDLVIQIEDMDGQLEPGDALAELTGKLLDGITVIEGTDSICVVP